MLSRLQNITVDADIVADDALDLLAEIRTGKADAVVNDGAGADPTEGAPPLSGLLGPADPPHTIPLKRSEQKWGEGSTLTEPEIVDDFDT